MTETTNTPAPRAAATALYNRLVDFEAALVSTIQGWALSSVGAEMDRTLDAVDHISNVRTRLQRLWRGRTS